MQVFKQSTRISNSLYIESYPEAEVVLLIWAWLLLIKGMRGNSYTH